MSKSKTSKTTKRAKGQGERLRQEALAEIEQRLTGKPGAGKTGKTSRKPSKRDKAGKQSKRMSALDAAARVLADVGKPMRVGAVVQAMEANGLWRSPNGKTPSATVSAAIIREIAAKGKESRFVRKDRGLFAAAQGAKP